MFNKRYIFVLILLIVAISALSVVSATDLNTADDVIADEVSVDGGLEQTDDVTLEAGKEGTFTQLNQKISNAPVGSTVQLTQNYSYVCPDDSNYDSGIYISKNLTINGNGYTIKGNGARTFIIDSNAYVTIQGVKFVNNEDDNYNYGGTIYNMGVLYLKDCEFHNSSAYIRGGAIFSSYILGVESCLFLGNEVPSPEDNPNNLTAGGAIFSNGFVMVYDTDFAFNYAQFGGAIMNINKAGIYGSYFYKNGADYSGGAIYNFEGDANNNYEGEGECLIQSSAFEGNWANEGGGALYDCIANVTSFYGNNAEYGNNMYWGYAIDCSQMRDDNDYYDVDRLYHANFIVTKSTIVYGEKLGVKVTDVWGNLISGITVKVKIGSKTFKGVTNSKGVAYISITVSPKSYSSISVTSDKGGLFVASKMTLKKLVVKKDTPKITASAKSFKVKATKKYTITVKGSTGVVVKNTKVQMKVNGVTYKATTNSKGQATFTFSKLNKKGTFTSTITLPSNTNYNKATKSVKITVK